MIGKIGIALAMLIVGFLMGFAFGTEMGRLILEAIFDALKVRFT